MIKALITLVILTLGLVALTQAQVRRSTESDVRSLYTQGKCDEGRNEQSSLDLSPNAKAFLLVIRGNCYMGQKDYAAAESDYLAVTDIASVPVEAYLGALYGFLSIGRFEAGINAATRYIDTRKEEIGRMYGVRATLHAKAGQFEKAIDDMQAATVANLGRAVSSDISVLTELRSKYQNDSRVLPFYDLVYQKFSKISDELVAKRASTDSTESTYPLTRGIELSGQILRFALVESIAVLSANQRKLEVEILLERLVKIEPNEDGFRYRASRYRRNGQLALSDADLISANLAAADTEGWRIRDTRIAKKKSPTSQVAAVLPFQLVRRGRWYWLAGDRDSAMKDFDEAISLDPTVKERVAKIIGSTAIPTQ